MATLSYQRAILGGKLGEGAAISSAMIPFLLAAILISWFGLQRRKWQQGESNDRRARPQGGQAENRAHRLIAGGDHTEGMSYLETLPRRLVTLYLPLSIILLVLLFPFYWMALTAIKPDEQLLDLERFNPFWTWNPTFKHIYELLFETYYPLWLWNTMMVAVAATVLSIVASVLAAYAIVRLRYKGAHGSAAPSFSPTWCRLRFCSSRCLRSCSSTGCSTRRSR